MVNLNAQDASITYTSMNMDSSAPSQADNDLNKQETPKVGFFSFLKIIPTLFSHDLVNRQARYSMPSVLQYLQHEWSRFELERAQWDMERAELQARIAFLQGEKKGQV